MIKQEYIEKFWSNVNPTTLEECWEWQGYINLQGYGSFCYDGKVGKAHRFSLFIKEGRYLTSSEWACHTCDNKKCVNPHHLYLGDRKSNVRDAVERGLWSSGNCKKTACKRGHDFTEENTRLNPRGERVCKTCDREIQAERRKDPEIRERTREASRRYSARKRAERKAAKNNE